MLKTYRSFFTNGYNLDTIMMYSAFVKALMINH